METAKDSGFFMPAEWHKQTATWMSWPHNSDTWPGKLDRIKVKFAEIAAIISRFQKVYLICLDSYLDECKSTLNEAKADLNNIQFFNFPTNDVWCRDYGPTFVINDEDELAFVDWQYNAWGGKYPFDKDNAVNSSINDTLKISKIDSAIICEGGAIEVNGAGQLLTTESVLLNKNRNPNLDKIEIEKVLKSSLGVHDICWLNEGLHNDDTDGHVDMLSRFYSEDGIVTSVSSNESHPDYDTLIKNQETLNNFQSTNGSYFNIVQLPLPDPHTTDKGQTLALSYANFLIINHAVIVPTYRQKELDKYALGLINELFPGRETIEVDCLELIEEGGAIHCMTQQQPAI